MSALEPGLCCDYLKRSGKNAKYQAPNSKYQTISNDPNGFEFGILNLFRV
jgi:hypothetical protein